MKLDQLREVMHAAPFVPFTIYVADGSTVEIPHPDFIALWEPRTAIVVSPPHQKPSYCQIDVTMITQLEIHGAQANGA
ncbi:MAG: hypothetical protein ABI946_00605 [Chthoniobacterales bacterium]